MAKHPLDSFLTETGRSQADAARELRCSEVHVSMIIRKKRRPSPKLAMRMQDWSGGRVTMEALFRVRVRPQASARKREAA